MKPSQTEQGVDDAIYTCNVTVGQWVQAMKDGINLEEFRALLWADLNNVQEALGVLTEYLANL